MTLQGHQDLCCMFILKKISIFLPCQFWESVQFYFLFIIERHGVVLKQRNNLTFSIQLSPGPPSILIIFPSLLYAIHVLFIHHYLFTIIIILSQSHCLSSLRRRSAAAHLLRMWVRIPPGAWTSICCECCVLGRGLCIKLITHPEESYWQWCVIECDQETSWWEGPGPLGGCCAKLKTNNNTWWITEIMNLYITVHSHFLCHFTYFMCQIIFSQNSRS